MKKRAATFGCDCTGCPGMRAALETIQRLEARILGDHDGTEHVVGRLEKKVDVVLAKLDPEAPTP